ncbi:MAG: hypothetical protein AUJ71_00565 [Candidatus Omnitrophica bacterium CG1_02_49_16]|nr:MAG: hypothetical protein AUJ71_00565 [Candidatus Omnitrophica bacterium CG1_02_49_16]
MVIPAYNEGQNIGRLIHEVESRGFPVLVVDDGSKDATALNSQAVGAEVLVTRVNQGKGAALRRGFSWLLQRKYAAVIVMDSDGQHDPHELDLFLAALNTGAPVVVGNRLTDPQGMSLIRRVTNRFMSWVISSVNRQQTPDSQCGYRALTREVLEKISLNTSRFEIESEILLEASRAGFRISSIPIRCVYRHEISRIHPIRDTVRFFSFLFKYLTRCHCSK